MTRRALLSLPFVGPLLANAGPRPTVAEYKAALLRELPEYARLADCVRHYDPPATFGGMRLIVDDRIPKNEIWTIDLEAWQAASQK